MSSPLPVLYRKLCRELAQAEQAADLHPRRQARQLGNTAPANAFLDIADHARSWWPAYRAAAGHALGLGAGVTVGKMFSAIRYVAVDRWIDAQRAYRGTLLGLRHGVDCARLLGEVATDVGNAPLVRWCDEMLEGRLLLLAEAERALAWFARHPGAAIHAISHVT